MIKKNLITFSSKKIASELYSICLKMKNKKIIDHFYNCYLYDLIKDFNKLNCIQLDNYDYILMTSRNSIIFFFSWIQIHKIDIPKKITFILIGKKTRQEYQLYTLKNEFIEISSHFEKYKILKEFFLKKNIYQKNILHLKGDKSKVFLKKSSSLRIFENNIKEVYFYKNKFKGLSEEEYNKLKKIKANYIFFTSSSSVKYFISLNLDYKNVQFIAIGKKTEHDLKINFKNNKIFVIPNNDIKEIENIKF